MSTIQPQMNTASFASLAGSPKASTGEAPQGLDFLTILAGSQGAGGTVDGAAASPGPSRAQPAQLAAGNSDGNATGKILPATAKSFAASRLHPSLAVIKHTLGDTAFEADTAQPEADASIIQSHAKATGRTNANEAVAGTLDAMTALSAEAVPSVQLVPEPIAVPVSIPVADQAIRLTARAPIAQAMGSTSERLPARTIADRFSVRSAAPVPAALAPLVAEAMEAKAQSASSPSGLQAASAPSARVIGASPADVMADPADLTRTQPNRAPEIDAVAINRTMTAAPAIPAATVIAARAAEPAKPAGATERLAPAEAAQADAAPAAALATAAKKDNDLPSQSALPQTMIDTPATNGVFNAATMVQDRSASRPVSGTVSAQVDTAQPQDFDTLVGRLNEAREAANPNLVRTTIHHAEFGQISLAFRADDARMSVTMTGSDAGLAPAVLAAASAAQAAGNDAQAREQSAQNQQQQAQQNSQQQSQAHQPSSNTAQSGSGNAAQGQADRQAANWREATGEARNSAGTSSAETTPEAHTAPRSNPPGIYA
jgi:hypothetical protein